MNMKDRVDHALDYFEVFKKIPDTSLDPIRSYELGLSYGLLLYAEISRECGDITEEQYQRLLEELDLSPEDPAKIGGKRWFKKAE